MAIIGSAEVEVRADVRKLGKDIKDSFNDLAKTADDIADKMGKSIGDSIKKNLDGLTIQVNIDDSILDDIIEIEEQIDRISNKTIKIDLDDSAMDKVNTYHGKTLRYDVDLDTTYLDAQLAKIADQKIDLKVDNKSAKAIKDSVEKTVSSIPASSRTVPVGMDIDSKAMNFLNEKMKKAMEGAQRVAKKHAEPINLELNTDQLMEHLEMLKDYETEDIELGITIEQTDLEEINSAIEALRQYNQANAIELEADMHMAKVMAQLAFLTRKRFVEIVPKINTKAMAIAQGTLAGFSGFNIMKDHTKDFIKSLTELDKQLPQTAMLLTALSAAVPAAGWGVGTLVSLIGDVATLSGLLVPGSAALAAYAGGMYFFNNAFEKANKEKYIPEITAQLDKFSSVVAGDFWSVAKPSYNEFAFKTLPAIYQASKGVNTGTAELASSFWDALGAVVASDRGMANLKETTGNIEAGMKGLGDAFEPAIQGLLEFISIGSGMLPPLGDYIKNVATEFDTWMQDVENQKAIEEWGTAGVETLKELGSIVFSTIGIFYSLYQAASQSGFPGLTEIATGLENINKKLSEGSTQEQLIMYGQYFNSAFNQIAASLSWVGPLISQHSDGILRTIETMGDIVSEVLLGIGDALTNTGLVDSFFGLFESMKTAVELFRPAFESIGTIMAVTFDFLGSALENITPILTQFFENLEQDAILVKPALMGMLDIFGEWGPRVMEVVGVVTNAIAEWFGKLDPVFALAGIALVGLGGVFVSVGSAIIGAFVWVDDIIGKIDNLLLAFGKSSSASSLLTGGIKGLGGGIGGLLGRVSSLIPGIGWIVSAFISAFAASEELRTAVGTFLGNAFKTLGALIQPILAPLGELFGVLMQGLEQIGAAVAPAFTGLFNALNSIMPIIQLVAYAIGSLLGAAIRLVIPIIQSLFTTISNVIGGVADVLGGAFNAIAAFFNGLIGVVKGLVSGDMTAVVDALKGMWDGLQAAWGQILGGLGSIIMGALGGVVDLVISIFVGLFEGIKSLLGSFSIAEAGQAILQSLIDGFMAKLDGIRQWLQDLTQKIIEWKGPPSNDATLLNDAGASIIQSLIDGFISVVQNVFSFLQNLTSQIVNVVMGVINGVVAVFQTGWNILVSIVQTVWNAIVTVITTILQVLVAGIQVYINLIVTVFQTGWTILTTVVQTVWNMIVTIITTVFQVIVTGIQVYINLVVTIFQTGWTILTTVVQTVWTAIQTVIQTAWTIIQTVIQVALQTVVTVFTTVWNAVLTVVRTVWNLIIGAIRTAITTVQTVVTTVLNVIRTVITTVWNTIKNVTVTVWNAIKTGITVVLNAVRSFITSAFAAFRSIITGVWNAISSVTRSVWNAIKAAINSVLNAIKSIIQRVFNAIKSTITSIMNGVKSVISSVWNAIRSVITSSVNAARSIVTGAFNAIRSVISSVMNAARSIISSVWSSIRSTVSSAVSGVRSTVSSGFNALRGIVTSAWNAVVSAIRSAISRMMGLVRGIPGQIKGALGNLGSLLTGAGKSIIQGLINGVTGMIGSLKSKFSDITNMIPDWKGPPDTDAKLLTNAGELIMEGLIEGLESKYGAVKNSLQGFTGELSQTVGTQIGADVGLTTSVRNTALSDADRRLSYRSNSDSMVQSSGGNGEVHLHFHNTLVNEEEIIMVVNREFGRG